jgi:hypothetical protein
MQGSLGKKNSLHRCHQTDSLHHTNCREVDDAVVFSLRFIEQSFA